MKTLEASLLEQLSEYLAFARRRLSNPDLAADAVQESLLKALRASETVRDEPNLKAWFYTILRRTIIDIYRQEGIHARAVEKLVASQEETGGGAEDAATCDCFRALLPTLKPEYADLIERLDLGDETLTQASERMGISRNNLAVRHHRARKQLRERLVRTCQACATHGCLDCTCNPPPQHEGPN